MFTLQMKYISELIHLTNRIDLKLKFIFFETFLLEFLLIMPKIWKECSLKVLRKTFYCVKAPKHSIKFVKNAMN